MKKLVLFILLLFSVVAAFSQAEIRNDGAVHATGNFPVALSKEIKGTSKTVKDTIDRNAIPMTFRDTGMFVYVTSLKKTYQLQDGITNTNWVEFITDTTHLRNDLNNTIATLDYKVPSVSDIPSLLSFQRGNNTSVIVRDTLTGGIFNWVSNAADDGGIYFSALGGGHWARNVDINGVLPEWFGAKRDGVTDDYDAFKLAAKSAQMIRKDVILSSGTYYLNNGDGDKIGRMIITKDVAFVGHNTIIKFSYNGLPLFAFIKSNGGGFSGARFIFTGTTQTSSDYTNKRLNDSMHIPLINTDPADWWAVFCGVGSNNLHFENLSFESNTPGVFPDNNYAHGISTCFYMRGNEETGETTKGLKIINVEFKDMIMGILTSGQENFIFDHLICSRRFGNLTTPPGHIIYLTGSNGWLKKQYNVNGVVSNIHDFGNSIPDGDLPSRDLAPLAIKWVRDTKFINITSNHKEGLIQSLLDVKDCYFENMFFEKKDTLASLSNVINVAGNPNDTIQNNTFKNITVISDSAFVRFTTLTGIPFLNNTFDNVLYKVDVNWNNRQTFQYQAFTINPSIGNSNIFKNIKFYPTKRLGDRYNKLMLIDTGANGTIGDVELMGDNIVSDIVPAIKDTTSVINIKGVPAGDTLFGSKKDGALYLLPTRKVITTNPRIWMGNSYYTEWGGIRTGLNLYSSRINPNAQTALQLFTFNNGVGYINYNDDGVEYHSQSFTPNNLNFKVSGYLNITNKANNSEIIRFDSSGIITVGGLGAAKIMNIRWNSAANGTFFDLYSHTDAVNSGVNFNLHGTGTSTTYLTDYKDDVIKNQIAFTNGATQIRSSIIQFTPLDVSYNMLRVDLRGIGIRRNPLFGLDINATIRGNKDSMSVYNTKSTRQVIVIDTSGSQWGRADIDSLITASRWIQNQNATKQTGVFYIQKGQADSIRVITLPANDSTDRVATTAWVKQQSFNGGITYSNGYGINLNNGVFSLDSNKMILDRGLQNFNGTNIYNLYVKPNSSAALSKMYVQDTLLAWKLFLYNGLQGGNPTISNSRNNRAFDFNYVGGSFGLIGNGNFDYTLPAKNGTLATTSDIISPQNGGTGLTTLGTAGQSIRVNTAGTGYEFYTPSSGGSGGTNNDFTTVPFSTSLAFDGNKAVSTTFTQTAPLTFTLAGSGNLIGKTIKFTINANSDTIIIPNAIYWKEFYPQEGKINDFELTYRADNNIDVKVSVRNANYSNVITLDTNQVSFDTYDGYRLDVITVETDANTMFSLGSAPGATDILKPEFLEQGSHTIYCKAIFYIAGTVYINKTNNANVMVSLPNPGLNK